MYIATLLFFFFFLATSFGYLLWLRDLHIYCVRVAIYLSIVNLASNVLLGLG
ncbi:hypothetical protein GGS24DRAFT_455607 [Hypoxylon argillaceum]|nr:hypothetical protein GGS24DRAFT_455607 [Hypoxylon argillaceum]KAI1153294.1 hypothetical protein F4825DRAFT_415901 [Nemania diffusa]